MSSKCYKSMGLSLLTHGILIACLLLVVSRAPESPSNSPLRAGEIVLAVASGNSQTDYLKESDASPNTSAASSIAEIVDSTPPEIPKSQPKQIDLPGIAVVESTIDATRMATTNSHSVPGGQHELTENELKMMEADRKLIESRQPAGPATSISVFGSGQLTGRKFVFLIDRSQSMGDQGLGVLKQARMELTAAINKLEEHHHFQIVAYNDRTATIDRRQLLPATDGNKQLVPDFLENLVAFGGTNHQNGLFAAMAFDADVIVMLTDGGLPELHDGNLKTIRNAVGNSTQIHTFQFGRGPLQQSDNFMKRLADQNSGTWQYIDLQPLTTPAESNAAKKP